MLLGASLGAVVAALIARAVWDGGVAGGDGIGFMDVGVVLGEENFMIIRILDFEMCLNFFWW